jgi:hypothetical protein
VNSAWPETSAEVAFELWDQDASMNRFTTVDGTRSFARMVLAVIDAHPELMAT